MMQRQSVGGGTNSIGKLVGDLVDAVSNLGPGINLTFVGVWILILLKYVFFY
jgi:hypothetical protein